MRICFPEDGGRAAAFFCDTLGIYPITPEEKGVLKALNGNEASPPSPTRDKWAAVLDDEARRLAQMAQKDCDQTPFYTLILNVANTCNMNCSYCFANHGEYASPKGIMSIPTAIGAIDACCQRYGFIGEIKFFGGEPLMASDVVRAVCQYVTKQYREGRIRRLPEFRMISNGTIMNDDICELIGAFDLQYVVSMDGPMELHDASRQMRDGSGSYTRIMENIARLRQRTGKAPSGIEITWNGNHERQGARVVDVIRTLEENTGVDAAHINLSCVMAEQDSASALASSEYATAGYLDEIFDEKRRTGHDYADKKFRSLVRMLRGRMRSGNQICEAGLGCFSVSAQGNVYPCLMFTDEEEFRLGTVSGDLYECADAFMDGPATVKRLSKVPCCECWANRICRQCMGINRFQTGRADVPLEKQCHINKKRIEKAILAIVEGLY